MPEDDVTSYEDFDTEDLKDFDTSQRYAESDALFQDYYDNHEYVEGFGYYDPNEDSQQSTNLLEILSPLTSNTEFLHGPWGIGDFNNEDFIEEYGGYFSPYDPYKEKVAKSGAELALEDIQNSAGGTLESLRRNSSFGNNKSINRYLKLNQNTSESSSMDAQDTKADAIRDYREDVFSTWTSLAQMDSFAPAEEGLWDEELAWVRGEAGDRLDDLEDWSIDTFIDFMDDETFLDYGETAWNQFIGKNGILGNTIDGIANLGENIVDAFEDSCVLSTAAYKQGLINSTDLMQFVTWRLKTQHKEFLGNIKWLGYQVTWRPISNIMLKYKWFAKLIKKLILNKWMQIIKKKKTNRIFKFFIEYTGVIGYFLNYKKSKELEKKISPKSILKCYKKLIIKYDGNDKAYKNFTKGLKDG